MRRAQHRESSAPSSLMTLKEAAADLSVSYWTVRGWVDAGKLPAVRLPGDGRLVRVERAEVNRLIAACREELPAARR
jgi:excisionase family DNA binding protein